MQKKEIKPTAGNSSVKNSRQAQDIYQNLTSDFSFKRVFKQKKYLISFINALLNDFKEKVVDVEYLPTEHLGQTEQDRNAVFDLLCRNEKGEQFLLEMQNMRQSYVVDRSLYYSTFLIQNQNEQGDKWHFTINAVYVICILNFEPLFMKDDDDPISFNRMMNIRTNKLLCDKLNLVYVSLPKFSKRGDELQTETDKWLYTMFNSKFMNEDLPDPLAKDKFFNKLLNSIKLNRLNKSDMETYLSKEEMLKYYISNMGEELAEVKEEGIQEGIQQGLQQGMQRVQQERQQTALNALKKGLSLQDVADITNLSISELKEIKSQL